MRASHLMGNSRGRIIMMAAQVGPGRRGATTLLIWLVVVVVAVSVVIATGENTTSTSNQTTIVENGNRSQKVEQLERQLSELRYRFETNRAIDDWPYYCLLTVYSLLMLIGTIFNSLILFTVVLRPSILSPRNIFVVNLAASDLLLCVFTMPFSFIEISMKMWQLGLLPCKLVAGLQATSIFVSTISITAIALDRYKVIVYPTQQEAPNTRRRDMLILASVWALALTLSLPLFCFRTVRHMDLPQKYETSIKGVDFCIEEWPLEHGRGIYSVISMIFQYVLPISIVSVVYAKISKRLQKRLIRRQQQLTQSECKQKRQLNLIKRTHTMLVSVSLVFGLSWLPLNLLNVAGDFTDLFTGDTGDEQQFRVVFAICHLIGCLSACTNPILYAYLNDNFRKEALVAYGHQLNRLGRLLNIKSSTTPRNHNNRRSPETTARGRGPDISKRLQSGQPEQSVVSLQAGQRSPEINHLPPPLQPQKNPPNSSRLRLPSSSASSSGSTTTTTNSTCNSNSNSTTSSTYSTSGGSNQELVVPGACDERDDRRGSSKGASQHLENSPSQQQWLTLATNLRPGGSHVVLNMERLLASGSPKTPSANGLDVNVLASSEQRRSSFQTSAASSGGGGQHHHHHHLGTTMRLCLCISRTSSESQVVHADEVQQSRQRQPELPISRPSNQHQQQKCPCQCHHNNKLGVTATRLRSSSQTSSLVAATASALASSAAAATAKVDELRRRASKLLAPLGAVSAPPSAMKHSTDSHQPESLAPLKRQRRRRRRDKRAHRHQNHCPACRDNHRRHRKQRRRENQRGDAEPRDANDLAAPAALTPSPNNEAQRSASMAGLGATELDELATMSMTMTTTAGAGATTSTSAIGPKLVTSLGAIGRSGSEQRINRQTNNKAPGETMSFQKEAGAMRRPPPANPTGTNGDVINGCADNLDEDCDWSHSSSLLASCHLYSHSSSCTCSCRSSFSCPFMQHLGRSMPPLPLVAPSAATATATATTTTTTTTVEPPGAIGQLRRKVSWRTAQRGGANEEQSPFMHRDTCGCFTSFSAYQHRTSSCSCLSTTQSPTASCGDGGSCERSIAPLVQASLVVERKSFVDEPASPTSIRQSTKILCNGSVAACPPPQSSEAGSRETTSREDTTSTSATS